MNEEKVTTDVYDADEASTYPVQPIQVELNFEKFKQVISDNLTSRERGE